MPDDLLAELDAAAKALHVSRTAYICMAVSQQMKQDKVVSMMPEMLMALNSLQSSMSLLEDRGSSGKGQSKIEDGDGSKKNKGLME